MQLISLWRVVTAGVVAGMLLFVVACTDIHQSQDYIRHTNSALLDGIDGTDMLQFQAKAGSEYPDGDPNAEALRIMWLQAWLRQTKKCTDGYTITKRRAFRYAEYNPAGYDLVYELQCKVSLPAGATPPSGDSEAT